MHTHKLDEKEILIALMIHHKQIISISSGKLLMTQYKEREESQAIDALILSLMHTIHIFLNLLHTHSNLDHGLYKSSHYW